jgi:hypothetical protein
LLAKRSAEAKNALAQIIGSIIEHGISEYLVIVSDDAGQFNVLLHVLCWIHANGAIDKIIPFTDQAKKDFDTVKDQVWQLYDETTNNFH